MAAFARWVMQTRVMILSHLLEVPSRSMKVVDTFLEVVFALEPDVHSDDRGTFYESYNKFEFLALTGYDGAFDQDNHSTSKYGVIRGIHYQFPNPQGKLVRCVEGKVWDVVVDLRESSPTLGQWAAFELSDQNMRLLWIPEGFGHGFAAMSPRAQLIYKTTAVWIAECDRTVRWNDPELAIGWPFGEEAIVSDKDRAAPPFNEALLMPGVS